MKKILVRSVLVFAMATSLIACSKDEVTTAPVTIVGKWEAVTEISKITINGQLLQDSTLTYSANELFVEFFTHFKSKYGGSKIIGIEHRLVGTRFKIV